MAVKRRYYLKMVSDFKLRKLKNLESNRPLMGEYFKLGYIVLPPLINSDDSRGGYVIYVEDAERRSIGVWYSQKGEVRSVQAREDGPSFPFVQKKQYSNDVRLFYNGQNIAADVNEFDRLYASINASASSDGIHILPEFLNLPRFDFN